MNLLRNIAEFIFVVASQNCKIRMHHENECSSGEKVNSTFYSDIDRRDLNSALSMIFHIMLYITHKNVKLHAFSYHF